MKFRKRPINIMSCGTAKDLYEYQDIVDRKITREKKGMYIEYTYFCEKCQESFVRTIRREGYKERVKCTKCKCLCGRDFAADLADGKDSIILHDSEIKTVGHLAMRNTDRMCNDQKADLNYGHNKYKYDKSEKELPQGMERIEKKGKYER